MTVAADASGPNEWSLSDAQRKETIERVKWNIASVGFFRGLSIAEESAEQLALTVEKKAYTVAKVESRTTTGTRPAIESLQAYTRKLSSLVIEAIKHCSDVQRPGGTAQPQKHAEASLVLDLTGDREFLTAETAEDALSVLLQPGAQHTTIKFSTKSFGPDAAEVAARAISNIRSTLKAADLSDVIAGRPEDQALAALRILSTALSTVELELLNLSDNALGEKGVRACEAALKNQEQLESLAFQNVGCSVKACQALDELLTHTDSLKQLHLYNNMSGDEGAVAISGILCRSPAMQYFKMVSSRVGPEGGSAIVDSLARGSSLRFLDLSDNPLTGDVAAPLSRCLPCHPSLTVLNLNDTSLGDEAVATLAQALAATAPQLEELELALNEITPASAAVLCIALRAKQQLKKLNVRENELQDKGCCLICNALTENTALVTLDLCGNQIRRAGAMAAAACVANKTNLQLLALDENSIPEDAIAQLKESLEAAGKLAALGPLDENMPEEDEVEDEEGEGGGLDDEDEDLANSLKNTL